MDKDLINVSKVLRLKYLTRIVKIVIPSSLPLIFTGLRLSLGVGWMVLIAAEMLAQNPGLGKFVWDEFQNGSSQSLGRIMVAVLTIGCIGFLLDRMIVGIARAFALSPKLLLLDEPFGMLDSLTRWDLQEVLMEVWTRTQVTAMIVTHDVDEAILVADRVVMMTNGPRARVGRIMEVGLPRPRSRKMLLEHPNYYDLRENLITFLAECDGPMPGDL